MAPAIAFRDASTFVTLTIGQGWDREEFSIHLEVVRQSPVLKSIFDNMHCQAPKIYHLGDTVREGAVRFLTQGLYGQRLSALDFLEPEVESKSLTTDESLDQDKDLMEMWTLAGALELPALQNTALAAIDTIYAYETIPVKAIAFLYKITTPSCALRHYMVACCANFLSLECCTEEERTSLPFEFLFDIAAYLQRGDVLDDMEFRYEDYLVEV